MAKTKKNPLEELKDSLQHQIKENQKHQASVEKQLASAVDVLKGYELLRFHMRLQADADLLKEELNHLENIIYLKFRKESK